MILLMRNSNTYTFRIKYDPERFQNSQTTQRAVWCLLMWPTPFSKCQNGGPGEKEGEVRSLLGTDPWHDSQFSTKWHQSCSYQGSINLFTWVLYQIGWHLSIKEKKKKMRSWRDWLRVCRIVFHLLAWPTGSHTTLGWPRSALTRCGASTPCLQAAREPKFSVPFGTKGINHWFSMNWGLLLNRVLSINRSS